MFPNNAWRTVSTPDVGEAVGVADGVTAVGEGVVSAVGEMVVLGVGTVVSIGVDVTVAVAVVGRFVGVTMVGDGVAVVPPSVGVTMEGVTTVAVGSGVDEVGVGDSPIL